MFVHTNPRVDTRTPTTYQRQFIRVPGGNPELQLCDGLTIHDVYEKQTFYTKGDFYIYEKPLECASRGFYMLRNMGRRGALIVLEGLDRSGKSTQCRKLVENLNNNGVETKLMTFPDRSTSIGAIINQYLRKEIELDDHSVHLLYSANRWERVGHIRDCLQKGIHVVCDRYSFSGIAFTSAKGIPGMDRHWCQNPENGLPRPDLVLFMEVPSEVAEKRAEYGDERYENREFQLRVRQEFEHLKSQKHFDILIDASKSIEDLSVEIYDHVKKCIDNSENLNGDLRTLTFAEK